MKSNKKHHPIVENRFRSCLILAFGFIMIFSGIALCLHRLYSETGGDISRPSACFAVAAISLFFAFALGKKKAFLIALGFMLVFDGILFSVIDINVFPMGIKELWPLCVVSAGLSFIPADIFVNKRVRAIFLFPAILLVMMGIVFLLFSTHVFTFSFSSFISASWPFVLMVFGGFLVGIYGIQQRHAAQFPYMEDDSELIV